MVERIVAPTLKNDEECAYERSIRPLSFDEYIGQDRVKENLKVFIEAALMRREALDHVLLFGPPGLGKTTLAYIIARELGVNIKITSGPAIERAEISSNFTNLGNRNLLFIDEIHRLHPVWKKYFIRQWKILRWI